MGLSRAEMLDCFRSDDLIGLGMEADAVRRRLHPDGVVTYANLSTRVLPIDNLQTWLEQTCALGGSGIGLTGSAALAEWIDLVRRVKRDFPALTVTAMTAAEVLRLGEPAEVLSRLRDAGLDSLRGEAAGLATDRWLAVHRAAHGLGMRTTAVLEFAAGGQVADRVDWLLAIGALQHETGGFVALAPVPLPAAVRQLDGVTAVESLKTLAICRMALPEIPNLELSWAAEGLKVLQMGLRFGANDVGSVLPPVVSAEGEAPATEEDLRRIIRDAGFEPVERDALYRVSYLV